MRAVRQGCEVAIATPKPKTKTGRPGKVDAQTKAKAVQAIIEGRETQAGAAKRLGVGDQTVGRWIAEFRKEMEDEPPQLPVTVGSAIEQQKLRFIEAVVGTTADYFETMKAIATRLREDAKRGQVLSGQDIEFLRIYESATTRFAAILTGQPQQQ